MRTGTAFALDVPPSRNSAKKKPLPSNGPPATSGSGALDARARLALGSLAASGLIGRLRGAARARRASGQGAALSRRAERAARAGESAQRTVLAHGFSPVADDSRTLRRRDGPRRGDARNRGA